MFYRSIGIWLINGLCLVWLCLFRGLMGLQLNHPSIHRSKKILNLTWFLWFSDISNRKRLIPISRGKRLHTPGESTSDSGRNDSGRTGHLAKPPAFCATTTVKSIALGLTWVLTVGPFNLSFFYLCPLKTTLINLHHQNKVSVSQFIAGVYKTKT